MKINYTGVYLIPFMVYGPYHTVHIIYNMVYRISRADNGPSIIELAFLMKIMGGEI